MTLTMSGLNAADYNDNIFKLNKDDELAEDKAILDKDPVAEV